MKRQIEFGCLMISAMIFFLAISAYLFAQGRLPISRHREIDAHVPETLISDTYQVVYDSALRIPVSASWCCAADYMGSVKRVPTWRFKEDCRIPAPRATHADYTHSGFDRGHLVPAADRSGSTQLMRSTFIMTNVCPQMPSMNRGAWKRLEESCRAYARHGKPLVLHVDVVFWNADTQRIGKNRVAVPHGFVKTIRPLGNDSILYARYFQNW